MSGLRESSVFTLVYLVPSAFIFMHASGIVSPFWLFVLMFSHPFLFTFANDVTIVTNNVPRKILFAKVNSSGCCGK